MKHILLLSLSVGFLSACSASVPYEYSTYEPEYPAGSHMGEIDWRDESKDDRPTSSHKTIEEEQTLRGRMVSN